MGSSLHKIMLNSWSDAHPPTKSYTVVVVQNKMATISGCCQLSTILKAAVAFISVFFGVRLFFQLKNVLKFNTSCSFHKKRQHGRQECEHFACFMSVSAHHQFVAVKFLQFFVQCPNLKGWTMTPM